MKPSSVTQADVDKLMGLGLDEQGITDVVEVGAYFNYINRIADGLGVDLEEWMK